MTTQGSPATTAPATSISRPSVSVSICGAARFVAGFTENLRCEVLLGRSRRAGGGGCDLPFLVRIAVRNQTKFVRDQQRVALRADPHSIDRVPERLERYLTDNPAGLLPDGSDADGNRRSRQAGLVEIEGSYENVVGADGSAVGIARVSRRRGSWR